ncbi:MAG: Lambda-carrageenase precursor [candidate division BRC1 bacterium ADurb.BinA364]|nr:MAG: Lambda-carrageenase precursor [candidate division BRC1 bacterium ADurb.BinA364]
MQFWIVDRAGQAEAFQSPDDRQLFNKRMRAGDLDGDGADELVFLRGSVDNVSCYALDGEKRWETPIPANLQNSSFGLLELGDFIPEEKGQEIAVGGSHVLFVLDSSGAIRHQSATDLKGRNESGRRWDPGQLLIPDLAVERGTPDRLWAASSRLRDRAIYRLAFGRNAPFLGQFPIPDDEAHLDALYEAARNAPAQPARDGKFKVIYTRGYFGGMNRETVLDQYRSLKALETDNLEYILMYDASDLMAHPRGSKFSTEQIVADARWMEEHGIPFGYFAMHGGEAWLSDRAIEAALEAAPNAFRFVYAAEDLECFYSPKTDEFLPWCVRMLNLMAPRGKKLLLKEKHDCWATTVADPAMRAALFDPALRQALVPIWATNQPVHPEAQLGAMMGLKDSGWVEEFGMSTQFFNWGEWEQRDINLAHMAPADISLRLELLGAALGAQWLHIEGGQPYMTSPPGAEIDPMARRHRDLVYELIRKGLLRAEPQIANLNATALAMRYHPYFDTLRETNATLKSFKTAGGSSPLRSGFMPMRQILEPWTEWAFAALAYGQRWHVETCFPATPLGWVRIAQEKSPAFEQAQWIETDGERVRLDGEWMDARQARPAVEARLREGAAAIPVSAPNACLVLHRLEGEGSYRAILLDPGYLAPEGVRTALECAAGSFESASDAISGRPLPLANGRVEVDIPRGAFRIVDLRIR